MALVRLDVHAIFLVVPRVLLTRAFIFAVLPHTM